MRKRPLALVAAGPISQSFLGRLPWLIEHLGPVKSSSFRLASRISNTLRAGFPVANFDEFEHVRAVFVSVPARSLGQVVEELAQSPVDWRHRTVFLCDADHDSSALEALALRGAATASLAPLEGFDGKRLLIEGSRAALSAARRLIGGSDTRLIELEPGGKNAYLAGITFLTSFSLPMLTAGAECFRLAGLGPRVAAQLVERLSQRTLRGFLKAGRKALTAAPPRGELAGLHRASPELAALYADAAHLAARARRRGRSRAAGAL